MFGVNTLDGVTPIPQITLKSKTSPSKSVKFMEIIISQ